MRAIFIAGILLVSLELTVLMGVIMSFIPKDQSAMMADVFPRDINSLKPDWKMFIYHLVIALAILAAFAVLTRFKRFIFQKEMQRKWTLFIYCCVFFLAIEIFSFNFIVTSSASWPWYFLGLALCGSCASKLLLPEISVLWHRSLLTRKVMVVGGMTPFLIFLTILAPATVVGCFLLWVVGIWAVVLIGYVLRLKLWRWLRWPSAVIQWADVLVWLSGQAMLAQTAGILMLLVIVSILAMTDPLAVLAKTAFGEHYYHFDFMLIASAYAASAGNVLGVDHNVFYGLGMPMMVGALAKFFFREVNYLNIFNVFWWLCIVYFVALFVCLRLWLGSVLLAAGAIFLAIKWQVFYSLSYPVSSIYPNGSTLRCLWDIPIFILLFLHLTRGRVLYLWLAAVGIGGAMVYIPTTGVDLYVALLTYLFGFMLLNRVIARPEGSWRSQIAASPLAPRNDKVLFFILAIPTIVALLGFWAICGNAVFHAGFWKDLSYYPHLFTNGFYNIWFWDNLVQGKWWNFVMSIGIPILYLGTFLWIGMRLWLGEADKKELLTMVICAYGLSLYHHYLTLSLQNNYYMRAVPLVWVIFYWVKSVVAKITSPRKRALSAWGVFILCGVMLLTNRLYQVFPNIWNTQNVRNPMVDRRTAYGLPEDGRPYFFHQEAWNAENNKLHVNNLGNTEEHIFFEWQVPNHEYLKALYVKEFDFTKDARLIASLTKPEEKVALLSSFEVHLLMQAKRRPLFFFFPVVASRGMYARTFPATNLHTKTMMQRTIDDLKKNTPRYIFVERVMLAQEIPESYPHTHEALLTVLDYIKTHYHVIQQGYFLVAMERNLLIKL